MKNDKEALVMRMINIRKHWIILLAICATILASGCDQAIQSTDGPATETESSLQKSASASTEQPDEQPESQFTSTPRYTIYAPFPSLTSTELPNPTVVPEQTVTQIPTSTPTRLPKLPTDEAEDLVMEFYASNGNCHLPCWWGIIPSQTPGIDAKKFLETFAIKVAESGSTNEITIYYVALPAPRDVYETFFRQDYTIVNGIVDSIFIQETFPSKNYNTISSFMSSVGPPEEVWIRSGIGLHGDAATFRYMLFYPHQGILISFFGPADWNGNQLRGCPYEAESGMMLLWASGANKTFEEWRFETRWGYYNDYYLPLDKATGMDVTEFYETFKEPGNTVCLQTPIEIWPTPGAVAEDWPTITPRPK